MFCNNCGKQNPDGAKFCSGCGSTISVEPPVAPVQPVQQPTYQASVQQPVYQAPVQQDIAPAPKKSNGKLIAIIISIVVVIGLVVGGIFLFGDKLGITGGSKEETTQNDNNGGSNDTNGGNVDANVNGGGGNTSNNESSANTPEALARKYAEASLGYDVNDLVDCMSEITLKEFSEMFFETDVVDKNAIVSKLESTIPDEKLSYTIISVELDEEWDEKEYVLEVIADSDESYVSKITDVVSVNVTYILEGEEETESLTCIKEDGKWKVYG